MPKAASAGEIATLCPSSAKVIRFTVDYLSPTPESVQKHS
jgi:hypothetical protein